jgi:hypothetical protein
MDVYNYIVINIRIFTKFIYNDMIRIMWIMEVSQKMDITKVAEVKAYRAKTVKNGTAMHLVVPAHIKKTYEIEEGEEIEVRLVRIKNKNQSSENAEIEVLAQNHTLEGWIPGSMEFILEAD